MARSRREFVKLSSTAAGAAALASVFPRRMWAQVMDARMTPGLWAPTIRALVEPSDLAARAVQAAKSAGAVYADVNIFMTQTEGWSFRGTVYETPGQSDIVGIGVRALFDGYWGFAAMHGLPTADAAAMLGTDATAQAKNAAKGKPHTIDLGAIPVATGTWTTPIEIDPFKVSFEEKADFGSSIADYGSRRSFQEGAGPRFSFAREERIFASTDGSATTQTIYTIRGSYGIGAARDWMTERPGMAGVDFLSLTGAGWEYLTRAPIKEHVEELIETARRSRRPQPVDIGRYDIVFDANAMAAVVAATIADATELDRAMGYLANGAGTSYLNDPVGMVGKFQTGSPLLTVTTDQSMRSGAATVKWDCEGVLPKKATLVKDGIVTDFQTTRESASWLSAYYQSHNMPVQSNGCAGSYERGTEPVRQVIPNLVMEPSAHDATFEDMVKDTKKGLALRGGNSWTDFQALNGQGYADEVRVINNGVLGDVIDPFQYMYRSVEFWKNLVAIGGKSTARMFGFPRGRGMGFSVLAVPGKVKNVAVTDPMRKA